MGDVADVGPTRSVVADVEGTGPIDSVEILHNNRVIERVTPRRGTPGDDGPVKLGVEVGWGERGVTVD